MFRLSKEGLAFVQSEMVRYETKQSAIIPALYRAQKENGGYITPDVVDHLSQVMDLPVADIDRVCTFYSMFNKKPVGRYHVQVCCNLSCAMNGGRELADHIGRHFGIQDGEVSADGKLSISRVECLGSCGTAPMMQVNETYYENLDSARAVQILSDLD